MELSGGRRTQAVNANVVLETEHQLPRRGEAGADDSSHPPASHGRGLTRRPLSAPGRGPPRRLRGADSEQTRPRPRLPPEPERKRGGVCRTVLHSAVSQKGTASGKHSYCPLRRGKYYFFKKCYFERITGS